MMHRISFIALIAQITVFSGSFLHATQVMQGNSNDPNQTFSFSIKEHQQAQLASSNLFLAAAPGTGGANIVDSYTVSVLSPLANRFQPIVYAKANYNGVADTINPLYDKGIAYMALLEGVTAVIGSPERPLVVTSDDPKTLYLINRFDGNSVEVISTPMPDATGQPTSAIVGIGGAPTHGFAAVAPTGAGTIFGDVGSGIAMSVVGTTTTSAVFLPINVMTGFANSPVAFPLDRTSSLVAIGNPLTSMSVSAMHWDRVVNRLYIALQVVGGAAPTDGAKAIVIGRLDDNTNQFTLIPAMPSSAVTGATNTIIGGQGVNAAVSIQKIGTLFTSTKMHYLIVVGGNGSAAATQSSVYALPLVGGISDPDLLGTIAKKDAPVENSFFGIMPPFFGTRAITIPATTPADMPTTADQAAMVGNGPLPAGAINDLFIHTDTVFVSVKTANANQAPGVYSSQAIFDPSGKISGWTSWQRAASSYQQTSAQLDPTHAFGVDPLLGNSVFMVADNGIDTKTVKRTVWGAGDSQFFGQLQPFISEFFPADRDGIQESIDLPFGSRGLDGISLAILTGLQRIMLIQTGKTQAAAQVPNSGTAMGVTQQFGDGMINQDFPPTVAGAIALEGGALDDLGPITAATTIANQTNNWLVVGGVNGIAILSQADGTGIAAPGLGDGMSGLRNGMTFKKIGDYHFVRKLIADDNFLYVLTDSRLDRIDLTLGNIGLGIFSADTLADVNLLTPNKNQVSSFLDAIVSSKLGLLATTFGLLRSGSGKNIQTDVNTDAIDWQPVAAPESVPPVVKLIAQSATGIATDLARGIGGYLITINASRSLNQSYLHRYVIEAVDQSAVTDNSVQLFPDLFVKSVPSFFASYGQFRNMLMTNGALYFASTSKNGDQQPSVVLFPANTQVFSGKRFLGVRSRPVPTGITGNQIAALVRTCASGSWQAAGDFALRINE